MGEQYGFSELLGIYGIPFGGNLGVEWVGWEVGLVGVIRPVLEFTYSDRGLDILTDSASSSAEFCRHFEEGIFDNCSGVLCSDVAISRRTSLCDS